ncbi:hypothetical protein C8R44DRAFT_868365 [Mycena epipterygia]|nr:hypothetical protein C8R44DRAFT_868365 [Mycena epipterygia]
MPSNERTYIDLLFAASGKYATWDPEWGRSETTRGKRGLEFWRKNSTFLKEGNIFLDGKAKKYNIPDPIEYDGGETAEETWVVSQNEQLPKHISSPDSEDSSNSHGYENP